MVLEKKEISTSAREWEERSGQLRNQEPNERSLPFLSWQNVQVEQQPGDWTGKTTFPIHINMPLLVIWVSSEQVLGCNVSRSAPIVSSSTIEQLKGRSRGGLLHTICVNSGGKPGVRLAQNHHQSTPKPGWRFEQRLSISPFICSFCLFSAKRGEYETNHCAMNLQMSSSVNRSRGGFSSG